VVKDQEPSSINYIKTMNSLQEKVEQIDSGDDEESCLLSLGCRLSKAKQEAEDKLHGIKPHNVLI